MQGVTASDYTFKRHHVGCQCIPGLHQPGRSTVQRGTKGYWRKRISWVQGATTSGYSIPSSVTKLEKCAFRACINMAEVRFDKGALRVIQENAFCQCEALRSLLYLRASKSYKRGHFKAASTWPRCISMMDCRSSETLHLIIARRCEV